MEFRFPVVFLLSSILVVEFVNTQRHPGVSIAEESPTFWMEAAQQDLLDSLRLQPNTNIAKNVIIFVGDGMGVSTVTASRIYKGQQEGRPGEDSQLSFEKFPHVALAKTYSVDYQVPDSASTATALFTGVKTNSHTLGVSGRAKSQKCESIFGNEVSTILQWAQEAGKDTGLITTTRVTHATPAALYAHVAYRDWESDSDMPNGTEQCKDIARQLVEDLPGRDLKVIFGGGRMQFTPKDNRNPKLSVGNRSDGLDLIEKWKKEKANRKVRSKYVTNSDELTSVRKGSVDYLLGLFSKNHMAFELDRDKSTKGEPSLSAMTKSAITILQKNNKGFFLMVEGGRIDHAHHSNNAKRALTETVALADAVQTAMNMTSRKDTLIVVTADHSHVFTVNGYPRRGHPILGKASSDITGLPFTTLMYTNGPGYMKPGENCTRRDYSAINTEINDFRQEATVPLKQETHGGEEVPIYAIGPMAHLIRGVVEQNYIAHVMAYASCIGRNKDHCRTVGESLPLTSRSGLACMQIPATSFAILIFCLIVLCLRNRN